VKNKIKSGLIKNSKDRPLETIGCHATPKLGCDRQRGCGKVRPAMLGYAFFKSPPHSGKTMPLHTDATEIRVTRADGTPLRFSSNLLSFLANRKSPRSFYFGDWLQSLDGEMLGHLQQLASQSLNDPQSVGTALEDLLSVIVHVLAAERQAESVSFGEDKIGEYMGMLHLVATLERLRRQGLLAYESVMSIEPEAANAVILSQEAFSLADEIQRQKMRGLH
jgi:hypothetical protein